MGYKNSYEVASELRWSISNGKYRQFERLPPSRTLAEKLGTARNTLRSALHLLEEEGILETRAGSGTYVTAASLDPLPAAVEKATPLELIDARFALEPHICRLCVLHGRREDFDALDLLCTKMEEATDDPVAFAKADTAFHGGLAMATRNNLLIWLIGKINAVRGFDEWARMRRLTLDKSIIGRYNDQHREVVDALRSRQPEHAAQKMKEHLDTARSSLMHAAEA